MAEYIEYLPVFGAIHDLSMDAFRRNDKKAACCYNKALNILCNATAADVVPVVHGRWMNDGMGDMLAIWKCSLCGYRQQGAFMRYCPNCGARMNYEA